MALTQSSQRVALRTSRRSPRPSFLRLASVQITANTTGTAYRRHGACPRRTTSGPVPRPHWCAYRHKRRCSSDAGPLLPDQRIQVGKRAALRTAGEACIQCAACRPQHGWFAGHLHLGRRGRLHPAWSFTISASRPAYRTCSGTGVSCLEGSGASSGKSAAKSNSAGGACIGNTTCAPTRSTIRKRRGTMKSTATTTASESKPKCSDETERICLVIPHVPVDPTIIYEQRIISATLTTYTPAICPHFFHCQRLCSLLLMISLLSWTTDSAPLPPPNSLVPMSASNIGVHCSPEILRLDAFPTALLIHHLDNYVLPKRASIIVIDAHGPGQGVLSALHNNHTWAESAYGVTGPLTRALPEPRCCRHPHAPQVQDYCRTPGAGMGSGSATSARKRCTTLGQIQEATLQRKSG